MNQWLNKMERKLGRYAIPNLMNYVVILYAVGALVCWRAHAHLFYSNWLNYCVYQATPYRLDDIPTDRD